MHRCACAGALLFLLCNLLQVAKGTDVICSPQCVNGECVAYLGNLTCNCSENWSGRDCSTFICDTEEKCQNGGTCFPDPDDVTHILCSCSLPYFGDACQYTLEGSPCDVDPCSNGATCYDKASGGYQCVCADGWWGVGCNYTVSTNISVLPYDVCQIQGLCNGHGECGWDQSIPTYYSGCRCFPGYDITFYNCRDPIGTHFCDEKNMNPCGEYGECEYVFGNNTDTGKIEALDYFCRCNGTHSGRNCTEEFDICGRNPCGPGNCSSILGGHYYECECPPGRRGYNCEFYDDPCLDLICENGGTCMRNASANRDGSYNSSEAKCVCCSGYEGDRCQVNVGRNHTLCQPNPCQNTGQCSLLSEEEYECRCSSGFTGTNCQFTDPCISSPCSEFGDCHNINGEFFCVCSKDGWGGESCDEDIDECQDSMVRCHNGGACVNSPGGYSCECLPEYTGHSCGDYVPQPVNCSSSQRCRNGGTCVDQSGGTMVCECPLGFTGDQCDMPACQYDDCDSLANNGVCDRQCFTEECGQDGREGHCLAPNTTDPWVNCTMAASCRQLIENGVCNPECNSRECLFDFYECVPPRHVCPAELAAQCVNETDDGVCDEKCNTDKCPFDSQDCNSRKYIPNELVVYILGSAGQQSFVNNKDAQAAFEVAVGTITNSNPVIEKIELLSSQQALQEGIVVPEGQNLYRVTIKLDLEYCSDQCVQSIQEAVNFLNAYYTTGEKIAGYSYVRSDSNPDEPDKKGSSTNTPVAVAVTVVVVGMLGLFVVGGVLIGKRKTIRAKIFFPGQSQVDDSAHDSSPPSKKRKVAHTDSATGTLVASTEESSITASGSSGDYIREGSKAAKMDGGKITWVDFRVPVEDSPAHDPTETAVVSQVGQDSRKWNYLHYSAVRNPEVMRELLEKCRGEDGKKWDINTAGPGGYTPLMLAVTQKTSRCESFGMPSRSSSSSDSSTETNSEQNTLLSPLAKANQLVPRFDTSSPTLTTGSAPSSPLNCSVDALLSARIKLDTPNDIGRTALHLAAVCARGDYVKKLLAAGANPNVQDNWGQSPLHAAIGAAADGAFTILTNFAKTDINLKSDGGTTPLMEAVKAKNIHMVKQLVKKSADISVADYEGRTAVHWAAMVNNVEALKLLIRQGPDTIKDTQDSKGQTALFLACREGAAESAKHLLDVFANATLLDNLDRSPMTMAYERQHYDIMEMLKSHGPYHYQLPATGRHTHAVPHHIQMTQHHHDMMRQQMPQRTSLVQSPNLYQPPPPEMMMDMQQMPPPEHFGISHRRPSHHSPEMQSHGQTFGDLGYPTSSAMNLGLPSSGSFNPPEYSKPVNTFFSNTLHSVAASTGAHTMAVAQPYYTPPSSTSQLPQSTDHPSPPTTYHQHPSPPAPNVLQNQQPQQPPHTTTALTLPYSQPLPMTDPSFSTYSSTANQYPATTSDSEQMMVNELITSISNNTQVQQSSATLANAGSITRPLQHLDVETNLPAYAGTVPTSDPYAPTTTQQQQPQQLYSPPQQPHSAGSTHSNRSPSALYPSPPNSDTLQHSEAAQQSGLTMGYAHASPPSLTPSPETRDELTRQSITTVEGLVQQHDYPSMMYGGADFCNYYSGVRFAQDSHNNETTV